MSSKKIIILIIILLVIGAGVFYWFWPEPVNGPAPLFQGEKPPALFAKEDYQIEERADGKYIVVKKVGLSAKVPDNWIIEIEGDDFPEPEYWVNLTSPDAEMTSTLIKGCGITLMIQNNKDEAESLIANIATIQKNPEKAQEIKPDYQVMIVQIDANKGLKWSSPEDNILGTVIGLDIPMDNVVANIGTRLLPEYKDQCRLYWNEFLENLKLN